MGIPSRPIPWGFLTVFARAHCWTLSWDAVSPSHTFRPCFLKMHVICILPFTPRSPQLPPSPSRYLTDFCMHFWWPTITSSSLRLLIYLRIRWRILRFFFFLTRYRQKIPDVFSDVWTAGDIYRHVIQSYKTVSLFKVVSFYRAVFPNVTTLLSVQKKTTFKYVVHLSMQKNDCCILTSVFAPHLLGTLLYPFPHLHTVHWSGPETRV